VVRIERDAAAWRVVDAKGETYAADAVVVAVPIVVLQRARISFEPPLPDSVLAAMGAIGCGPVAKVFATFDTAFWSPHRAFWVVGEERLPLELFVDVTPLAGSPTLCGFAVGEHAAAVEAMTEGERCRLVDDLLAIARVSRV
ncbi:MAG: oxidoreductase, partial [Ilumatobacteraceae bacterium]|nr:oxidoreductase [Ilumatobacteraceae bacterium]